MEKYIKDINFDELQTVRKRCITFAGDGNTVVRPYKTLYGLEEITNNQAHKTLYIEVKKPKTKWEQSMYFLFNDLGKICVKVSHVNCYTLLNEFIQALNKYSYFGVDGFLKRLREAEKEKLFINKVDIEVCNILGKEELAEHYIEYRKNYLMVKEKEKQEKKAKRKTDEEKRIERINKTIADAKNALRTGGTLLNEEFEDTTIILCLLKKHGIKVPLRTRGWINRALAKIWYCNEEITYSYYSTSRDSKVFYRYLKELEKKILNA